MNLSDFTIKRLRVGYFIVCIAAFILYATGYSFALDFLDWLLIAIIFLYPIIEFIKAPIKLWIKVLIALPIGILVFYSIKTIVFAIAFGSESKQMLRSWEVDEYKIILNKKQGWAGPPYKEYDLIKYRLWGLINKQVAYANYSDFDSPKDLCKILFQKDRVTNGITYEFDSCVKTIKKVNPANKKIDSDNNDR